MHQLLLICKKLQLQFILVLIACLLVIYLFEFCNIVYVFYFWLTSLVCWIFCWLLFWFRYTWILKFYWVYPWWHEDVVLCTCFVVAFFHWWYCFFFSRQFDTYCFFLVNTRISIINLTHRVFLLVLFVDFNLNLNMFYFRINNVLFIYL